jgi:hypothetical protein
VPSEWPNLIINALTGLGGAAVGAIASSRSATSQHKREINAERAREVRKRADAAAEKLDQLFKEAREAVPTAFDLKFLATTDDRAVIERPLRIQEELEEQIISMPSPWRQRVDIAREILQHADELGANTPYSVHYQRVRQIVYTVTEHAHEVLDAFLRDESLPALPSPFLEYDVALKVLIGEKEEEFAAEIVETEEAREAWLAKRPELKALIEESEKQATKGSSSDSD